MTRPPQKRRTLTTWPIEDLRGIAETDDLHVSPFREDGATYGTPTWIWSIVHDGRLFVRAYNGTDSRWYRAAMTQQAGRTHTAGSIFEVSFTAADPALTKQVDAAYRDKYAGSAYLPPMITEGPQAATVEITPREP